MISERTRAPLARTRAPLALVLLLVSSGAKAGLPPAGTPSSDASVLSRLAARIAEQVESAGAEPPIALRVSSPSGELARGLSTVLAGQLAHRRLPAIVLEASEDDVATARRRQARALLRLHVELVRDRLKLRGELVGTWVNFWSGSTASRPASPAELLAHEAPADALAVALAALPPPPALELLATRLAELPAWPGALAAEDLDGDGRDELITLDDDDVRILRADGTALASHSLAQVPLASTPCREPFGTIRVEAPGRIAAFACGRARGEILSLVNGSLQGAGPLEVPRLGEGERQVTSPFVPGQAALATPRPTLPGAAYGETVLRLFADGEGQLEGAFGQRLLRGLGSAATLVDLDGDGAPELAAADWRVRPEAEALRIWRLAELVDGAKDDVAAKYDVELKSRAPLHTVALGAARVLLLVAADLDGDGRDELVAAAWEKTGSAVLWRVGGRSR